MIEQLELFPSQPGVYLMKDRSGKVLYVGKAKNLKQRVKQYFQSGGDSRSMVPHLIGKVYSIDTIVVSSEKEALLLENNLIKKHKPRYNALLKDDKSYIALCINKEHAWPMVKMIRYRGKPKKKGQYFGPYTSAYAARETLDLIQRIFPLRECSDEEFARRTRPCILYDIKRCLAPCVKKCSQTEYQKTLHQAVQFLRGKDQFIIKDLSREMQKASDALEFERADALLRKIRSIEKTVVKQHVDNPQGKDTDVIGLYREGSEAVIVQLIVRGGQLIGSHEYAFTQLLAEDEELLSSFILQHYHALPTTPPQELIIPLSLPLRDEVTQILTQENRRKIQIVLPKRGDKLALSEMAMDNAKSWFHRKKDHRTILENSLLEMQEKFRLKNFPHRIECIDSSSFGGKEQVASIVVFIDGKKTGNEYRHYKISSGKGFDDYAALSEVIQRRYQKAKEKNHLPDLLIIDGGKGHLNVAVKQFDRLNIVNVDLIGFSKEQGRHDLGLSSESVWLQNIKDPISLPRHSSLLFFLQKIRDEAHRFAISLQKKRRLKMHLKSQLEEIQGIGEVKRKQLLKSLGSLKRIKEAEIEDLLHVPKITKKDAERIWNFFR